MIDTTYMVVGNGSLQANGECLTGSPYGRSMVLILEKGTCSLKDPRLAAGNAILLGPGATALLTRCNKAFFWVLCFRSQLPAGTYSFTVSEDLVRYIRTHNGQITEIPCTLIDDNFLHKKSEVPKTLLAAKKLLDTAFADKWSLEGLASEVSWSKYKLIHGFREQWNTTPMLYLTSIRLQQACHMLESTVLSVDLIAEQCGYSSTSYFIQSFKKKYGITPQTYRNRQ